MANGPRRLKVIKLFARIKAKMLAIRALEKVYEAFQYDLSDPAESFVHPQLEALNDPNSEVRAAEASTIGFYGIKTSEILFGLITRLADRNEFVR